jgi:transposase-like protein
MGSGAISIVPLITMATWLIRDAAEKRDRDAAKAFFRQAIAVVGHTPVSVMTDGHRSYPRAIRQTLGNEVAHRTNVSLNSRREQDHRGMKQRYYPMRGFGNVASTARFCRAFDELRHSFRYRSTTRETISLGQQRQIFYERLAALQELLDAVA